MSTESFRSMGQKLIVGSFTTILFTILAGLLSGEAWFASRAFGGRLGEFVSGNINFDLVLWAVVLPTGILITYLWIRDVGGQFQKILDSERVDILFAFVVGVVISFSFRTATYPFYQNLAGQFSAAQIIAFLAIPISVALLIIFRTAQIISKDKEGWDNTSLLSDKELHKKKNDLLDYAPLAERFAHTVYNNGSSESFVFGIDAPWGTGKSSFVGFCEETLDEEYGNKIILYRFSPLRYEDRTNLLEKFIDGLVRAIQKEIFVPDIRPLVSNYSRFIRAGKTTLNLFGFNFEVLPGSYTVDDALCDLAFTLDHIDRKVIVIVDDLDRLSFSAVKDVLFAIKQSFTLPNISYILCYDTQNISALEGAHYDEEQVSEFLEKFVNIKIGLYLTSEALDKITAGESSLLSSLELDADPIVVHTAIGGLRDIYKSRDFHKFVPFVGDLRKLKRLINTVLLLNVASVDFDNTDFNKEDLINLLLIYINYPDIFRKIHDTETCGKKGLFSALLHYEDGFPRKANATQNQNDHSNLSNSEDYINYLESLSQNQKFLVEQLFNIEQRLKRVGIDTTDVDRIPQEVKHSLACFNGGSPWSGGRNLEEYVRLIVNLKQPQKRDEFKFYIVSKDKLMKGEDLNEIFKDKVFSPAEGEGSYELFWRVVVNSSREFDRKTAASVIQYLLKHLPDYSVLEAKELSLGLRHTLNYYLAQILDNVGWEDQRGGHQLNTDENVEEIADWIFGEGIHSSEGVIKSLSRDGNVLGLYDLLTFRLTCNADRGGNLFDLQRALLRHANPNAKSEGDTREIAREEMREISQKIFGLFNDQYIEKERNIFALIDDLEKRDLAGQFEGYLEEKLPDIESVIAIVKSRLKGFITYQLGNSYISMGVGCGLYDITGSKDSGGIRLAVNEYLFDFCFNPDNGADNYGYFLDYLLLNLTMGSDLANRNEWIPNINEITKVLLPEKLRVYWEKYKVQLKDYAGKHPGKKVFSPNYTAVYSEDLPRTFDTLDSKLKPPDAENDKDSEGGGVKPTHLV